MVKILVVDDENDILDFLSYNLKKEGFEVFTANNGKKAIEMASEIRPNLIVLDIMMPELDGIEVCRQLKTKPELSNTIGLLLSEKRKKLNVMKIVLLN